MERISDELNKIIMADVPSYGFKLLFSSGILKVIFAELHQLQGVRITSGMGHKDNFYHTIKVLDNVCELSEDLWLRWAALLHDIAKPQVQRFDQKLGWTFHQHEFVGSKMVPRIFRRFKLPLDDRMRKVKKLVRLHLRPISLVQEGATDSAIRRLIFEAGDDLEDLMKLCRSDITSKNLQKVIRYKANFDELETQLEKVEEKDRIRNLKLPISGNKIMEVFDLPPSRPIGLILDSVKEAILGGELSNDSAQALAYVQKIGPQIISEHGTGESSPPGSKTT